MARLLAALWRLVLLALLVAAAALWWRVPLAQAVAEDLAAARGLAGAEFRIVAIAPRRAVIEDLSLEGGAVRAERVRFSYALGGLAAGRLDAAQVEGLAVAPRAWDGALGDRLSGPGGGGTAPIDRVRLTGARIALPPGLDGAVSAEGELALAGPAPGADLRLSARWAGGRAELSLKSEALAPGGRVALSGRGEADLATLPPGLVAALPHRPTGGRVRLEGSGEVALPRAAPGAPAAWIAAGGRIEGVLRLERGALAGMPARASGEIAWRATAGDGRIAIALPRPGRLTIAGAPLPGGGVVSARIAAGSVVRWTRGEAGGAATVALEAEATRGATTARLAARAEGLVALGWRVREPWTVSADLEGTGLPLPARAPGGGGHGTGTLDRVTWRAEGTLAPDGALELSGPLAAEADRLAAADVTATGVRLAGPLRLAGAPAGAWTLASPGLDLAAEAADMPGLGRLDAPAALSVEAVELSRGPEATRLAAAVTGEGLAVSLAPEAGGVRLAGAGGRLEIALDRLVPLAGRATLTGGRARLPAEGIAVGEVEAALPLGPGEDAAPVSLAAAIRDLVRPARVAPLGVTLEGERRGDALSLSGSVTAADGAVRLALAGGASLAPPALSLRAGPATLAFRPGGLQPSALAPALAALERVEGEARVSAHLAITPGREAESGATLELRGLSAARGDLAAEGLAGRLVLDSLTPPTIATPRRVTADRLIAGVPVTDAAMELSMPRSGGGRIVALRDVRADLAGGEVRVPRLRWDLAAAENALAVELRHVALGTLLRSWRIAGISGEGRLSGTIPVRVGPDGVAIENGSVRAGGPGVLRVDWGAARERLVASGEQVRLAVEALEDFRYDSLSVRLDQPPGGTLEIAVGLAGRNPAVLDGYPFEFNVTLRGNLAPILDAVREGRRIGGELIRGGLGGG